MTAVEDDIRQAKAGDRLAFGRLVGRFQEVAIGYALRWLNDPESARDAAQDAFIDAYLHLDQLEQHASFPGWLRRIIVKHCDRRTRKKSLPEIEPATPPEVSTDPAAARQERDWLRREIESLPEHERLVTALHYLGDEPQQDVADFLELPLSTVKKRLFSARRRLEAKRADMDTEKPPITGSFAARIELFLAIRACDVGAVRSLLDVHPELIETEEAWSRDEALARGLPIAHRVTPLILASARGDRTMVELLLSRGARPNANCGCPNGETALLAATLQRHTEVARALLLAEANPNAVNGVGHSALHLAAMRGHDEIWRLLLQHGGDAALRAVNGRTPLDYRATRTSPSAETGDLVETGIKAIDLLAPIARGMLVRVHGAAGTGLMVLLAELARRFGDRGQRSVFVTWEPMPWQKGELEAFTREVGIDDCTEVLGSGVETPRSGEPKPFAYFVFQREGHTAEAEAALPWLAEQAAVAFVVDPWASATRGDSKLPELRAPFGALICTSRELASEGVYPAVDPDQSRSTAEISDRHERIQREVRRALRHADDRAQRVKGFLCQPFVTWQHQNGKIGEVIPLDEMFAGFERVLQCA